MNKIYYLCKYYKKSLIFIIFLFIIDLGIINHLRYNKYILDNMKNELKNKKIILSTYELEQEDADNIIITCEGQDNNWCRSEYDIIWDGENKFYIKNLKMEEK